MEDIRDFIEAELMETTTTTTTVSISNELDQLESEAEAIESVYGKISDILQGVSGRSFANSKCSDFVGKVLKFYDEIR